MTTASTEKKRRGGLLREEFGNPERRTAYYMVLPALLIILVVVLVALALVIGLLAYLVRSMNEGQAVKALAENWSQRLDVRERFLDEARILRRADSDHIVRVYDIGEVDVAGADRDAAPQARQRESQ